MYVHSTFESLYNVLYKSPAIYIHACTLYIYIHYIRLASWKCIKLMAGLCKKVRRCLEALGPLLQMEQNLFQNLAVSGQLIVSGNIRSWDTLPSPVSFRLSPTPQSHIPQMHFSRWPLAARLRLHPNVFLFFLRDHSCLWWKIMKSEHTKIE